MLTQSNITNNIPISACSSSSSESFIAAKCSPIKNESIANDSPDNPEFNTNSPKSDRLERDSATATSTPSSTPFNPSISNNNIEPQSPVAPIMAINADTNGNIGATAAVTPTSTVLQSLLGAQMPVDFNAMFSNFFSNSNSILNAVNDSKSTDFIEKPSTSPNFDNFCLSAQQQLAGMDQNTFLQLSHLLAAQQPNSQQSETLKQNIRQGNGQRHDSTSSNNGIQDRKRSYPYTFQYCVLCQKNVHSSKLPCHIRQCHVGKPMFQCPACDFTSTYSKNNVKSHMVSLHGLAGDPISYMDQYAGQVEEFMKKCFPNVRGRGRPVHGRLSPSNQNNNSSGIHQQSANSVLSPQNNFNDELRNNTSPISSASQNNMRLKIGLGADVDSVSTQKSYNNNGNQKGFNLQKNVPILSITTAAAAAAQAQRFNEMFAMAMFNRKSINEKLSPFLANNNNDYPLQNLNPLLYLQQSQLNASTNAIGKQKEKNENEKPFNEYFNGVEQLLKDFGQSFEQNNDNLNVKQLVSVKQENSTDDQLNSQKLTPCFNSSNLLFLFDEENENSLVEPRYLPQSLKWTILNKDQLENTVFKTFSNSSEIIEKLDLSIFESLLDKSNAFLTNAQIQTIANVRERIGLKSFEIMFAVHRLDLQVLKPKDVKLVMSISPTDADIRRFLAYEQSNSITSLNDNEQFILQLSKIDRLKEKLALMNFMGSFNTQIQRVNQQLTDLMSTAKMLQNSSEFHSILHLLLTCGNLINGDFNSQLVQGFKPSKISEMCNFNFSVFQNESSKKVSLLEVLAACIAKKFMHLKRFCEKCKSIKASSKISFLSILQHLQYFESGIRLIDTEIQQSDPNQVLSNFLAYCESETTQFKELLQLAKDQIIGTLQFFGELTPADVENEFFFRDFQPEKFFETIFKFSVQLENAIELVASSSTDSSNFFNF